MFNFSHLKLTNFKHHCIWITNQNQKLIGGLNDIYNFVVEFFLFGFIYGLKYLFLNQIRKIGRERKSHKDTNPYYLLSKQ